jgi:hypothetical protein
LFISNTPLEYLCYTSFTYLAAIFIIVGYLTLFSLDFRIGAQEKAINQHERREQAAKVKAQPTSPTYGERMTVGDVLAFCSQGYAACLIDGNFLGHVLVRNGQRGDRL